MTGKELASRFQEYFKTQPRFFRAPGRVNLIGEHTDYNDGFVMPAAIGFFTTVAAAPRGDRKLIIRSENFNETLEFDLDHLPAKTQGKWVDYLLGVAWVLAQQGIALRGANLLVQGEVPIGAGLSSSAAVEVSTALTLLRMSEDPKAQHLALSEIAKLCRRAENEFVGAQVGIMDQFVACMGKAGDALLLDCRSLDFQLVPIPSNLRLVICNTMVKHELSSGNYNIRRRECDEAVKTIARNDRNVHALRDVSPALLDQVSAELSPTVRKRCEHVIRENQRVLQAADSLRKNDFQRLGELMAQSHISLRDLYEVSCKELDIMVDAAHGLPGFVGGRMTGGGFGGCTVNLVETPHTVEFSAVVSERYERATGIKPQIYTCAAVDGAQELG